MDESHDDPIWNKRYQFRFAKDDHEIISYLESLDTSREKGLHTTVLKHLAFLGFSLAKEKGLLRKKYALSQHVNQLKRGEITILQSSPIIESEDFKNFNSNNEAYLEMQKMYQTLQAQHNILLIENEELKRKQLENPSSSIQSNDNGEILNRIEDLLKLQIQTQTNTSEILDKMNDLELGIITPTKEVASEISEKVEPPKNNDDDEFEILDEEGDEEEVDEEKTSNNNNASTFVANLPFNVNAIASSMSKLESSSKK
ncbi:hypothetical protein ABC382_00465 [Lysinibacillus sp. 1P01SD]|uniref:hypothetical protein n=1 Tax=Lysinibacillus sp. 1P01SD TaxID=3132285 RepID=UPI0039A19D2C